MAVTLALGLDYLVEKRVVFEKITVLYVVGLLAPERDDNEH